MSAIAENSTFLTVEEAAELLRVSAPTIYRRIHDGTLPAVRVGQRLLVPRDELVERLYGREQRGA
jgi:excisionase family DNA binding protein